MGYFTIKSKKKLSEIETDEQLPESDYATLTPDGYFVQLEYHSTEDAKLQPYPVKPGIWAIAKSMSNLVLLPSSFTKDKILESFVNTKEICEKIDCFFRNIHVYKEWDIEVPKRGVLLHGPQGTGKSSSLTQVANKYGTDGRTAVIIWHTDKFESYQVKDFIKSFEYRGVDRLILIAEDLGGVEIDQARMKSDSSLLSLLDNQEKTFTIPVLIVATTNFPENFLGNLTNRSGRFDDKIKVGHPSAEARVELLKFYAKGKETEEAVKLMGSTKCKDFPPAHIREVVIRSAIYERSMVDVILEMCREIEEYTAMFQDSKRMGF